ncbi:LemA family protein [Allohahella marinimesophila]|uniref:LemA family protein n=1 Tax=Allohahella marinimesophila TaxID=1054972 RepID=A0ABP7P3R9_9GAMM
MSIEKFIVLALIGGLLIYIISMYNQLVSLRNRFRNAFSQIDVQLQRRHDLIPNLVEAARAYLGHERATLEQVMTARNNATTATAAAAKNPGQGEAIDKLSAAETMLDKAMGRFYAVAEAYPDLKADGTISQLMEELSSTENRVGFARQAYNDAVMVYHTYREQFPSNLVAGFCGFTPTRPFTTEDPAARQGVKVNLGTS